MKKLIASLLTAAMLAASTAAFAQIPETVVETVDNAAVVAFGDVTAHQSMRIEGDVYAGGTVKFDNSGEAYLDGDIISPNDVQYQDEYSAILRSTNRRGVNRVEDITNVINAYYPGTYLVDNAIAPEIPSYDVEYTNAGWVSVNEWSTWPEAYPKDENGYPYYTISENTALDGLQLQGAKLLIDASQAPVYVKAEQFSCAAASDRASYVEVIGDNPVYLIAPGTDAFVNVTLTGNNTFDFGNGNVTWIVKASPWGGTWNSVGNTSANSMICADIYDEANADGFKVNAPVKGDVISSASTIEFGNTSTVEGDIYAYGGTKFSFDGKIEGDIVTKASEVILSNSGQYNDERITGNVNAVEAKNMTVSCAVKGNIVTSANDLTITGGANTDYVANIQGTVYAPNADVKIYATSDNGINRGQLICNSLDIFGEGAVIWGKAENKPANETPAPQPTNPPEIPDDEEIELKGVGYAYIFGYEPEIVTETVTDAEGNVVEEIHKANIYMGPNDLVSREQVAAMIMRMIDQAYDTTGVSYPVTDNMAQHAGTWYERGLAYLASKGAFDGVSEVKIGGITRGEVAKLVACGLNLTKTTDVAFEDIADSEYAEYIKIMNAYGFMQGMDATHFVPNEFMTRAQFCSMFNQIIGRNEMGLEAQDGTTVTPEIYSIVDLDGHWAADIMLKATSAYDQNGLIDVETRLANIRNTLDNYDAQKWF